MCSHGLENRLNMMINMDGPFVEVISNINVGSPAAIISRYTHMYLGACVIDVRQHLFPRQ